MHTHKNKKIIKADRPGALFTKGRKQLSHVRRSQTVFATVHVIHETNRWCDERKCGRKLSKNLRHTFRSRKYAFTNTLNVFISLFKFISIDNCPVMSK